MKDTQLALRCNELLGCSLIENAHAGFLRSTAGRQHDSPNLINEQSERQRRAFVHFTQYDFSNPFQLEQPNYYYTALNILTIKNIFLYTISIYVIMRPSNSSSRRRDSYFA